MKHFLKYRVWDFILCVCISLGIVFHIFSGFLLEDSLSSHPAAVAGLLAVEAAALILFSYSRLTTGIGIGIGIVLLALALGYTRGRDLLGDETENSLIIALLATFLTGLLVYLACRTRVGIIALFLVGVIVTAGTHFLHWPVSGWYFLLFLFAAMIMFWYRTYMKNMVKVSHGMIRLRRFLLQAFILGMAAFVVGGGAYMGIVRPLQPPTRELKLITLLKQMDILEVVGVHNVRELLDPNLISSQDAQDTELANQKTGQDMETGGDMNDKQGDLNTAEQTSVQHPNKESAQEIFYDLYESLLPWLILCIAIIIAVAFILRYWSRRRWKQRMDSLSPQLQVVNYYEFFIAKLARAGYKRPGNHTLYQYAADISHPLEEYTVGGADFLVLTEIYIRTFYGRNSVTEEEAALFVQFYNNFRRALRRDIGIWKYMIKIFWF